MTDQTAMSSYLSLLPALFQQDAFLGRFLLVFEHILSSAPRGTQPALEQIITQIDRFFRPYDPADPTRQTPAEFLPWLAEWVSLSLREDWDDTTRRTFLREIVSLYRQRGTKAGLQGMLQAYVGEGIPITVYDDQDDFGFDPPAHFFQVEMKIKDRKPEELRRKQQIAMAIIDQEKPAHTFYGLQILMPTMRLLSAQLAQELGLKPEDRLILGKNTLLGTQSISA